jgi:hypothetical protein
MVELTNELFGAFDSIEYDGIEELIGLIETIKGLDDKSYEFVMSSSMRKRGN